MKQYVILGNGPSKTKFKREDFKDHLVISCNFPSEDDDFCVIQDPEVPQQYVPKRDGKIKFLFCYDAYVSAFRNKWWFQAGGPEYQLLDDLPGMNSGLYALKYCIDNKADSIHIFGMDTLFTDEYKSTSGDIETTDERVRLYKGWRLKFKQLCAAAQWSCQIVVEDGKPDVNL